MKGSEANLKGPPPAKDGTFLNFQKGNFTNGRSWEMESEWFPYDFQWWETLSFGGQKCFSFLI